MLSYILVILGGALETGARFWMSGFIAERGGEFFPLGALVVNVSGSFVVGFLRSVYGSRRAGSCVAAIPAIFHDRCVRRLHNVFLIQLTNTRFGSGWRLVEGAEHGAVVRLLRHRRMAGASSRSHASGKIETTYANSRRRRPPADFYRRKRSPSPSAAVRGDRFKSARDADGRCYRVAWADGIWEIKPFAHGKNSSPLDGSPNRN